MNISIFASIGSQNLWDELILKNEIELLKQEFWEDTQFQVASYDSKNPLFQIPNTKYFEYFPLGIKNPKNIWRNMKSFFNFLSVIFWSDRVVIGWGGIMYDSEIQSVWDPLNQWIFRVQIARFFRKKIYFYAVWVDIKQEENLKKIKKIFKKAWKITVRDEKSQEQLKSVGIQSDVINDPVMWDNFSLKTHPNPLLEEREQATIQMQPLSPWGERIQEWGFRGDILGIHNSRNFSLRDFENYDFQDKKIWLALRSWYIGNTKNTQLERLLIEELCSFIEKKWGKIVFLPHSLHQTDEQANDYEYMKQFLNYDRDIYTSLWEVYTAYTHHTVDVIISMRLHSMILWYIYWIPQIALSYSQKTDEVIKKLST